MRTIIILFSLILMLAACGTKDAAVEQPAPEPAEAQAQPQPAPAAPVSTNTIEEVIPEGPVGTLQLTDGRIIVIDELVKLGDSYYIYIVGKLNGRSSTVVSLTRFSDLQKWDALVFKDQNNFMITTKSGKEWSFSDARVYLGSDKAENYAFYSTNDDLDRVLMQVKKSDVATIKIK